MIRNDGQLFLLIPGKSKTRTLHPGKVIELDGSTYTAAFETCLTIDAGTEVVVYAEVNGKFFQQGAKVILVRQSEPTAIVAFTQVGEPVSAESRQTYRVSTVTSGICAKVDRERDCPLVDVSPEGFAIITAREYAIGSMANVEFSHETMKISTAARVQTVKALPGGKFRHGFLAGEKKSPARKSLEQISIAMQRQQLRRMRVGAA
jgi:hypothetical protein